MSGEEQGKASGSTATASGIHEGGDARPIAETLNDAFEERRDSLWVVTFAPTAWALHFTLCYAMTAIFCARRGEPLISPAADLRIAILVATGVALVIILAVGWHAWRQWNYLDDYDYVHDADTSEHRHEFLGHASFLLTIVSFIGVVFTALPALFIDTCA